MAVDDEAIGPVVLVPIVLDRMGIAELERYITALRAEIARTEAQIEAKRDHRSVADGFFKF